VFNIFFKIKTKMIFNFLNIFAEYNYIYFNKKIFQTKKFHSSHSVNKSSIIPVISYFNAKLEKDTILNQNNNK
jgi:hypothetical protein